MDELQKQTEGQPPELVEFGLENIVPGSDEADLIIEKLVKVITHLQRPLPELIETPPSHSGELQRVTIPIQNLYYGKSRLSNGASDFIGEKTPLGGVNEICFPPEKQSTGSELISLSIVAPHTFGFHQTWYLNESAHLENPADARTHRHYAIHRYVRDLQQSEIFELYTQGYSILPALDLGPNQRVPLPNASHSSIPRFNFDDQTYNQSEPISFDTRIEPEYLSAVAKGHLDTILKEYQLGTKVFFIKHDKDLSRIDQYLIYESFVQSILSQVNTPEELPSLYINYPMLQLKEDQPNRYNGYIGKDETVLVFLPKKTK